MTLTIGYCRDSQTGNFIATWVNHAYHPSSRYRRQQIVVLPGAFFRILPRIDRRSVANCIDITAEEATALGFIVNAPAAKEVAAV